MFETTTHFGNHWPMSKLVWVCVSFTTIFRQLGFVMNPFPQPHPGHALGVAFTMCDKPLAASKSTESLLGTAGKHTRLWCLIWRCLSSTYLFCRICGCCLFSLQLAEVLHLEIRPSFPHWKWSLFRGELWKFGSGRCTSLHLASRWFLVSDVPPC